jgi:hypothetical protein
MRSFSLSLLQEFQVEGNIDVSEDRQIGNAFFGGESIEPVDYFHGKMASVVLIGGGRIIKAIIDHLVIFPNCQQNDLSDKMSMTCLREEKFRFRVYYIVRFTSNAVSDADNSMLIRQSPVSLYIQLLSRFRLLGCSLER